MKPETRAEMQWRLRVEQRCREIAAQVVARLLPGTGFALFVFDLGAHGSIAYASNAKRADLRKALREWLDLTATPEDP